MSRVAVSTGYGIARDVVEAEALYSKEIEQMIWEGSPAPPTSQEEEKPFVETLHDFLKKRGVTQ